MSYNLPGPGDAATWGWHSPEHNDPPEVVTEPLTQAWVGKLIDDLSEAADSLYEARADGDMEQVRYAISEAQRAINEARAAL